MGKSNFVFNEQKEYALSYEAYIGIKVKDMNLWVINNRKYSRTTSKHQTKLKEILQKNGIQYISATFDTIYSLGLGDNAEEIFKKLFYTYDERNFSSLFKLAALMNDSSSKKSPVFDCEKWIFTCRKTYLDRLFFKALTKKVTIPRWAKQVDATLYEQLKLLNKKHSNKGVKHENTNS